MQWEVWRPIYVRDAGMWDRSQHKSLSISGTIQSVLEQLGKFEWIDPISFSNETWKSILDAIRIQR